MVFEMFELKPLSLPGTFLIQGKVMSDDRGSFHKKVHAGFFEKNGLEWSFPEQFYSVSMKDVVRGMHFQAPPHDHVKLIYCTRGKAKDVLLDLRKGSPTYGKCTDANLNANDGQTIYVPKGIAHGFHSLEDYTTVHYCVSTTYAPESDLGIRWDTIPYDWKIASPQVSPRDQSMPNFKNFESPFVVGERRG